jgi:hypothetical protein
MVGQHRMARMYMRLANDAVRGIGDQSVLGWVDLMAVTYLVGAGAWSEMDEIIPRGTAIQEALGDRRRLQETVMVGACGDYFRGHFEQSLAGCDRVAQLAVPVEEWQPRVWSLAGRVQASIARFGAAETLRQLGNHPVANQTWKSVDGIWLAGAMSRCYLKAGDLSGARREADRVLAFMPDTPPVAGYVLEGYAGPTETWLQVWATARTDAERTEALGHVQKCLATLKRFAGIFPVGEPRAALCQGIHERTAGRPAKAAASFERSVAAATRLEMPYEAGRAALELGALIGASDPRGAAFFDGAYATFDRIGAVDDAREVLRRRRPAA